MKPFDIFLETDAHFTQIHAHYSGPVKLEFPNHYHTAMELLYCYEGSVNIHMDQATHLLEKDNLALISPLTVHGFSCPQTCSYAIIQIPETLLLKSEQFSLLNTLHSGYIFPNGKYKELIQTLSSFVQNDDQIIASYYAMILLTLCIREIQDTHGHVISFKNNSYPLIREILTYIQGHYKEHLTLDILCDKFNIGKSTMSKLINKDLQCSLPDLTNKYRMLEAKHLLIQTKQSITEIAEHLGYSSVCNFNRIFQKHYGTSPREYRKQQKALSNHQTEL